MRISTSFWLAAVLMAGVSTWAHAGWHEFWAEFDLHRRRVEAWPEPFTSPDRETTREPFRLMADNGWKQQNTLNDEWFHKDSHELTHAGKIKLRQMMNEFPPHRRQVFVLEGQTQEVTSVRVASVYKCLSEVAPDQQPCSVLTTRIPGPVGTAWYAEGANRSTGYWAGAAPQRAGGPPQWAGSATLRTAGTRNAGENGNPNVTGAPSAVPTQGATVGSVPGG